MPGVSRAQRAEAKYNVVLDFSDYGLHTAAVSGNLGLVKYALDHGQPVNSALDGVLPLHAACSGGNDLVVRLLIDHGADVNAQRLPRRYSNDKHRNAVTPLAITGASGSTPLHFAAAHGHTNVVLTLLLHGAHPDRPDKHGITPEMLARQNGFSACADVLREWCHNKDRDLREREALGSYYPEDQTLREKETHNYCGSLDCRECATRKRIRMKRSLDNAIHMLRHSSSHSSNLATPPHSAGPLTANEPPSPSDRPFGEYTFHTPDSTVVEELPPRRPSLPHVLEVPHHATPTAHRSRRPSNLSISSSHRPRSAGDGAEPAAPKVKGKISLLNIFKKGIDTPDSISSYNSSSSAVTSASTSPTGQLSALAMTSLAGRSAEMLASEPSTSVQQSSTLHQRLLDERPAPTPPPPSQTPELHGIASHESLRGHITASLGESSKNQSPVRPGILRGHGRSSSSGLSASQAEGSGGRSVSGTSGRSLRFDPSSSALPSRRSESGAHPHAHHLSYDNSRSSSSTRARSPGAPTFGLRLEDEPEQVNQFTTSPAPIHPPPRDGNIEEADEEAVEEEEEEEEDEEEDDEYGLPMDPHAGADLKARLSDLQLKNTAEIDAAALEEAGSNTTEHVFECPFSINRPPPVEEGATVRPGSLGVDNRTRGDSLSSMVTDTSNEPSSSYVTTPALEQSSLPAPAIMSLSSTPTDQQLTIDITTPEKKRPGRDASETPSSGRHRARFSLDLDIRNISSHAQAEALVQRAQQRIFALDEDEVDDDERKSLGLGDEHTPLSARLAAYGESLAIERKFKAQEDRRRSIISQMSSEGSSTVNIHSAGMFDSPPPIMRQSSLQERPSVRRASESHDRPLTGSAIPPTLDSGDVFLTPDRSRSTNVLSVSNPEQTGRLRGAGSSSTTSLVSPTSASPGGHAHAKSRSETLPMLRSAFPRSRTPDPESSLSYTHNHSHVHAHSASAAGFGTPLSRFPTCPTEDSFNELVPHKSSSQARQAARAQKLAKMGFSSGGDTWRDISGYASAKGTGAGAAGGAAGGGGGGGGGGAQRHRFGGIKTLVQNLTGRT